ncbi:rhodanese-like domain-containing protein [Pontivivens insulae]|uniref:Rhodanese domain-containing protein n=1 Tax=Pontivivens insulae TaxID=1639689 RepID=A0A2R8A884_9RHOB|nr:rhodanese-like domain-containing protein [Pontivivens insulae]RED18549.1 rhodanese-related sulfurtransferase [Pontivivens insulae]SPF28447.1 hypothetical protein POI8812_00747 [Pontivivens insulae]
MPNIEQFTPTEAYEALREDETAALVDVRSRAEWTFVGLPDLAELGRDTILAEWRQFPGMTPNPSFLDDMTRQMGGTTPQTVLFICRSGARSQDAAIAVSQLMEEAGTPIRCINVAEGFEGDLDGSGKRGGLNGWKAANLPWKQS